MCLCLLFPISFATKPLLNDFHRKWYPKLSNYIDFHPKWYPKLYYCIDFRPKWYPKLYYIAVPCPGLLFWVHIPAME